MAEARPPAKPGSMIAGVAPATIAVVRRQLRAIQEHYDIGVLASFVGGGRMHGMWDASSDVDVYSIFLPLQPERCRLRRMLKTADAVPTAIKLLPGQAEALAGNADSRCIDATSEPHCAPGDALPTIEHRLWDVDKLVEMIYAGNGDAIDWLRADTVIDEVPSIRAAMLAPLLTLPDPAFATFCHAAVVKRHTGVLFDGILQARAAARKFGSPAATGAAPGVGVASAKDAARLLWSALTVQHALSIPTHLPPLSVSSLLTAQRESLPGAVAAAADCIFAARRDFTRKHADATLDEAVMGWLEGLSTQCRALVAQRSKLDDGHKSGLLTAIEVVSAAARHVT